MGDEDQAEHNQKDGKERANGDENFVKEGIPSFTPLISIFSSDVGLVDRRIIIFEPG